MKPTGTENFTSHKIVKRRDFLATAAAVDTTLCPAGVFSTRLWQ